MTKRKIALGSIAASALFLAARPVAAQLIYEPFDYGTAANSTNLANTTGTPTFGGYFNPASNQRWFDMSTNGTGSEITLQNTNLAAPAGQAPATGGKVDYGNPNSAAPLSHSARIQITPGAFTSGTIYYSMSFTVTNIAGLRGDGAGGFFATLSDGDGRLSTTASPSGPARLQIKGNDASVPPNPTSFTVGIKAQTNVNTPPQAVFATKGPFAQGDTIFVVCAYTFNNGGGSDDTSSLWVNPTSLGGGTAPAADAVASGGADVAGISSFSLRQGNNFLPQGIQVDEVRIDTTWAGVTAPAGAVWNGSSGDSWADGTKWSTSPSAPNAAAQFVTFGSGAGGTVNVTSGETIGTMNIKNTNSYTIGGAGASALTLDGGVGGAAAINVMAVMDATGPGTILPSSHTINAPLLLNSNLAANIATNQTLEISGNISGNGALDKNGGGTLLLSGNNSFMGNVTAGNGVLAVNSDSALGNSANTVTINGGTVRTAGAVNGSRTLNVNSTVIGNASYGGGTFDSNGLNSTFGPIMGNGTLTKVGSGVLTGTYSRVPTLKINAGAVHAANSGTNNSPGSVSTFKTLTIAGATDAWTAKLDLDNNAAAIDYTGASVIDAVQNQLKSGFNGGPWGGNGIDTSAGAATASSSTKTGIGYGEATAILGANPTTYLGQTIDSTTLIMQYALFGDVNLDGSVDTTDFNNLAANFSQSGKHWTDGDFNYDGSVDSVDFNLLASNFSKTLTGPAALFALVPEPASLALLGLAAGAIGLRRRRA